MDKKKQIQHINNLDDLIALRKQLRDSKEFNNEKIYVCAGGGCIASGSLKVKEALTEELKKAKLDQQINIVETGCLGPCAKGPVVVIEKDNTFYQGVKTTNAADIVSKHIKEGVIIENLLHEVDGNKIAKQNELPFFKNQNKLVLGYCGKIDPSKIEDYIAAGGYDAMSKALTKMNSDNIIEEVKKSGLRGRGGAGFSTGMKWSFTQKSVGEVKYILCNADEGDPGAYMDRSILEGDPHSVIEGMIIGAFAIGSQQGYVYVRAEYPLAIERLQLAIDQARKLGILGNNILNSGFNFDLEIRKGSGAFVCGEETALMTSIEGKRGEPRPRPPYPAEKGLWNKPTVLNNVETFSNIPHIINQGGAVFAKTGTEKSTGTKIFALAGTVKLSGLVEVAVGTPLRKLIFDIGGGISTGKEFKAAQMGGPSGGCIPAEHLDVPLDYEALNKLGAIMGSGGLIVMDETSCMVDVARFFMEFVQEESCGKCVPCREGTARMLEILNKICDGKGEMSDLDNLEKLAVTINNSSLCGLGQTAPNPVLSTLRHFREEYIEHIQEKRCRTAVCKALTTYEITDKCIGCTACKKSCPVKAISGNTKEKHAIDSAICIRCGLCMSTCRYNSIIKYGNVDFVNGNTV
ncbi:MAG: NADH-quinone oxidoreductase subunit NuoF [Bacteroidota bacterium]